MPSRTTATTIAAAFLVLALVAIATPAEAGSNDLLITWASNSEADLGGYLVSYGTSPGSHPTTIDVENVTAWRLTGLTGGLTYYIVVQAYDGAGNISAPSAEVTGIPGGATGPSLTLSMSDSPDPIAPGANLTYTLNWSNAGSAAATGVVLTDVVPVNTTFVSATGGGTQAAGTVTWTIGTLAAGASGSAQLVVRVNSPLANGTVLTNAAAGIDSVETPSIGAGTVTTTVSAMPILSISKTDGPDPVAAGSNITYALSYANNGVGGATGVVVSDTLPVNTTFVSASAGGSISGSTVTWSIGSLPAGGSGSVQMVVRVTSPLANGTTITNGTYSVDCAETAAVTGSPVTTTATSSPTLTLTATDAPDPVAAGANITWTLAYSNTGNMNASGTVLTASVPAGTTFVSASTGGTQSAGTVTWTIGTLPAGGSGTASMTARVTTPAMNGAQITHAGGSIDCNETTPVTGAVVTTTVTSSPTLGLTLADAPDPVAAGGNITYTLSYSNTGTMNASGVVLTAPVPGNATFVSATAGGTEAAGIVTWNLGALNAGASGSAQMVVRVTNPLANGTFISLAGVAIDSAETAPVMPATITTTVTSAPILGLTRADSPDPVSAGANLTYTLTFSNTGSADATGVILTDTVPANTTFVSATLGGTLSGSTMTWSLGNLAAGASASAQLVVRVASPLANGTLITSGTGSLDSTETSPVTGVAATTTVASAPILAVTHTDAPDPVNAGSNLVYTINYSNGGNANATATMLRDTLPANTTYVGSSPAGALSAGVVSWSLGTLAAGGSGTVTLTLRVNSPLANGTLITSSGLTLDSNETTPVTAASITTSVGSSPSFALTATDNPDPVQAGANLTYTFGYTNNGNANATATVLTAALPANTTFVSATAGGTQSGGTVTWSAGTVNAAASGSVQMVVRVASPMANGATITSGALSVACAETAAQPGPTITTTVSAAPTLTVSAVESADPIDAGANLTYTLSYANNGNASATTVVLSDTLPANTTFVSATGGGTASGSVVTWNLGALAAGASGSTTLTVRVVSPLTNGTLLTHGTYSIDAAETAPIAGASITTTVRSAPILAVTLTDAPDPVAAGSNITYTLSYNNTGNMNATSVMLVDAMPTNATFVSATAGGVLSAGSVTWSLGTVNAGASGSVQMVARVGSPLADGTLISNLTCTIDSAQTNPVPAAAVTTTVTSAPILTLARTDSPDPVPAGSTITYTLNYSNVGSAGATGVVMTAPVPANTTFVSATAGGVLSGGSVTWSLGAVAAAAGGSTQMVVRVTSPLANGTIIDGGAASIDSAETAPAPAPAITTTVTSAPLLAVTKTDAPDPVSAGANLTYTISYINNGNTSATSVVLTDTVPANTSFVSATNGGVKSGSTITWNLGTIAAAGAGSVSMTVQVASPLNNGTSITGGTCTIDSAETSPVTATTVTTSVASAPSLGISATDAPDPVLAGANLTWTLTYTNSGNMASTQTIVTATLPANTTFVSATASGLLTGGTVTWSLGSVDPNTPATVQLVARVASPLPAGTMITLGSYTIDSTQTTPVAGAAVTTAVVSNPVLSLTVVDGPDPVLAGADLTYTLTASNTGNAPATGSVMTAPVPAGTSFVSATGGGVYSGGTVTWSIGTLNAGASLALQMVVHVPSSATSGTVLSGSGFRLDSNETTAVLAMDATTSVTEPSAPIVTGAIELTTRSIYLVRGDSTTVEVDGSSFQTGAVVNLSADITTGTTAVLSGTVLTTPITVSPGATVGVRTVTLTNPDGRSGSLPAGLEVVKDPDGNHDCRVDGVDLNQMARAWSSAIGETNYSTTSDLDGDGYVGPDDLSVFVKYYASKPHGCP